MSLIKKLVSWVKNLFTSIPEEIMQHATQALAITVNIKKFLESPVADVLTALIPGSWDDALKAKAIHYLGEIGPCLTIIDECKHDDPKAMVECWIRRLGEYQPDVRNALLFKLATLLTDKFNEDDQLPESLYALAVQANYTNSKGFIVD